MFKNRNRLFFSLVFVIIIVFGFIFAAYVKLLSTVTTNKAELERFKAKIVRPVYNVNCRKLFEINSVGTKFNY
jgi:hypothetical protein